VTGLKDGTVVVRPEVTVKVLGNALIAINSRTVGNWEVGFWIARDPVSDSSRSHFSERLVGSS
jgi:hypothetical protein